MTQVFYSNVTRINIQFVVEEPENAKVQDKKPAPTPAKKEVPKKK